MAEQTSSPYLGNHGSLAAAIVYSLPGQWCVPWGLVPWLLGWGVVGYGGCFMVLWPPPTLWPLAVLLGALVLRAMVYSKIPVPLLASMIFPLQRLRASRSMEGRPMMGLTVFLLLLAWPMQAMATILDEKPRTAVVSAFEPEWASLYEAIEDRELHDYQGVRFVTGELEGQDIVLYLSGLSMVNAAMTTQMALDRFNVTGIIFSGIAGGVNPDLNIGDLVIAEHWGQYLEAIYARETEDGYVTPPFLQPFLQQDFPNFDMIHPMSVAVVSEGSEAEGVEQRFWFPVDPEFFQRAGEVASSVTLEGCLDTGVCLESTPKIIVGGNGVSGSAFVDNAEFREYVYETFSANLLDMESAAVAHVAHTNGVPFIAFRGLSDLAGGSHQANELPTFLGLAAENSSRFLRAFLASFTTP